MLTQVNVKNELLYVDVGMHHQGVFRVPGLQHEITDYKNQFERGWSVNLISVMYMCVRASGTFFSS